MKFLLTILLLVSLTAAGFGQAAVTPNFRVVVAKKLKLHGGDLEKICPSGNGVADRVFREYGAIFVAHTGGIPPPTCIFENEQGIQIYQAMAEPYEARVGGVNIVLQKAALESLLAAESEAAKDRLSITPRGGSAAATRTYVKTLELWRSRFVPALNHWVGRRRITRVDAVAAQQMPIMEQVKKVFEWEAEGLFFSMDLSKSILYSVAVPGASQHNFMLALDVVQFTNPRVRQILAKHGWFQTVKSDQPHFTFLGLEEKDLPLAGLKAETIRGQKYWIPNMD